MLLNLRLRMPFEQEIELSIIELKNIQNNTDVRSSLISLRALMMEKRLGAEDIKSDQYYDMEIMANLLMNEDPKVRKNAVLIMGHLDDVRYAEIIYQGYMREDTLFVKSSYLKALREYDYSAYEESLRDRKCILEKGNFEDNELKHIAEELHELKIMLPDRGEHTPHIFCNPQKDVNVFLTCRKEMTERLISEVRKVVKDAPVSRVFCGVSVKTKDIGRISDIRIFKDMIFPVNGLKPSAKENLVKDILAGDLFQLLDSMHEANASAYKFRLSGTGINTAKTAREIEAASKGRLINSVSAYEIELRLVDNKDGKTGCLVKLFTKPDYRFKYRRNTIATSLHPVNAASVINICEPYLTRHAQVLDPCCGVGTLLIERNKVLKGKYIYGVDIFGTAIDGARENAALANQEINFIQKDYFDFRHEYLFDEIITELPRLEKETADEFYRKFFQKSMELLDKNGTMILVSGEMGLVKKHIRLNKVLELVKETVINEKESVSVYIIVKKSGANKDGE